MPIIHARRQIREAVKDLLGNLPTTQARVFTGRSAPLDEKERPGLVIVAPKEETGGPIDIMGDDPTIDRTVDIVVVGYDDGEDIEDRLDQIALEVEKAMGGDPTLGGSVLSVDYVSTAIAIGEGAKKRPGQIRITYQVRYSTPRSAPQTLLA